MNKQFNSFDSKNDNLRPGYQADKNNIQHDEYNYSGSEVRKPDDQYGSTGSSNQYGSSDKKDSQGSQKEQQNIKDKAKDVLNQASKMVKMTALTVTTAVTVTTVSYASGGEFLPELTQVVQEYGGDFIEELSKPLVEPSEGMSYEVIAAVWNNPDGDPNLPGYVHDTRNHGTDDSKGNEGYEEVAEVETEVVESLEEETETTPEETTEVETTPEETTETETEPETTPVETQPVETTAVETSAEETTAPETTAAETRSSGGGSSGGGGYVPETEAEEECEHNNSYTIEGYGNVPVTCHGEYGTFELNYCEDCQRYFYWSVDCISSEYVPCYVDGPEDSDLFYYAPHVLGTNSDCTECNGTISLEKKGTETIETFTFESNEYITINIPITAKCSGTQSNILHNFNYQTLLQEVCVARVVDDGGNEIREGTLRNMGYFLPEDKEHIEPSMFSAITSAHYSLTFVKEELYEYLDDIQSDSIKIKIAYYQNDYYFFNGTISVRCR